MRAVLALAALLVDAATASPPPDRARPAPRRAADAGGAVLADYDAVIVGAGWAGLRAARTLLDAGVSSLLLLEAGDYVGGRSKSVNSDGATNDPTQLGAAANVPLDLGSEWQYVPGNGMEGDLRRRGFFDAVDLEHDKDDFLPLTHAQIYMQSVEADGAVRTELLNDTVAAEFRERVWEGFMTFRRTRLAETGVDQSYSSAAEEYAAQFLETDADRQYLNLVLDLGEVDYTGDLDALSFAEYTWAHAGGSQVHYVSVPGAGYGNIAAAFAAPFASRIRRGARVSAIDYAEEGRAVVSFTEDGAAKQVGAKTVLVTVSLGVLKAGTIAFTPRLPEWKQEAIDHMGFGVANKCILQWDDDDAAVWPRDAPGFELITAAAETAGRWTTFFNPTPFKGVPLLEGIVGGDDARAMERQTDEEVVDDVLAHLRAMFPAVRRPDRVLVTRWGQEEHVRGAYAFKVAGRDFDEDAANLQWPVDNVWFAGEATSGVWYGTAVGAWETGREAARDMVPAIGAPASGSPAAPPVGPSASADGAGRGPAEPAVGPAASSDGAGGGRAEPAASPAVSAASSGSVPAALDRVLRAALFGSVAGALL